jgi:enolase
LIHLVCRNERLRIGQDVGLGIDAAASEFYDKQKEVYNLSADYKHYKPASIYRLYSRWQKKFGIEIVEDGCAEDDYHGWYKLTALLGNQLLLVGDDLFVTNQSRLHTGIISNIANSILIKPNQIGTLTETMQTIQLAKKYKYQVVISHRSGETNDDFIADLAVAVSADYIKAGSLVRGERVAKYNRLLKIAEDLKQ